MIEILKEKISSDILENEPLANHCTFRIGGSAKYFFVAKSGEEIKTAVEIAKELDLPIFIFSGGSNILFADQGFDGLVIKIQNTKYEIQDTKIIAEAGVALGRLVEAAADRGLTGLEWAAGIPGTIGGAVRGNAGAYGRAIGESVESVDVLEIMNPAFAKLRRGKHELRIMNIGKNECRFRYRDSIFKKNKDIILKVVLVLKVDDREKIKDEMKKILKARNEKLPLDFPSAGSVFKNIKVNDEILGKLKNYEIPPKFIEFGKIPAAWFIEQCNLKDRQIGGAKISEKHANFIVNTGKATAKEVAELIELVKTEISQKFGMRLEEEIEMVKI